YPVIERWGLVWIWMGEAADADPRGIVDWHILGDGARDMRGEHLHVRCNYQLITDNLLDLSHISFVHPRTLGSAARLNEAQVENEITDDHVTTARWLPDIAPPPTYARFNFKGNVDRFQITTFNPPGFVKLFAGAAATGTVSDRRSFSSEGMAGDAARSRAGDAVGLSTFNAMTPETEHTTHYFWCISQDRESQGQSLTDNVFRDIQATVQEDVAVFEAQQRWLELKPEAPMVVIKSDAGPLAARRIIEQRLRREAGRGM